LRLDVVRQRLSTQLAQGEPDAGAPMEIFEIAG
jgi:hypothetical protein